MHEGTHIAHTYIISLKGVQFHGSAMCLTCCSYCHGEGGGEVGGLCKSA